MITLDRSLMNNYESKLVFLLSNWTHSLEYDPSAGSYVVTYLDLNRLRNNLQKLLAKAQTQQVIDTSLINQ